MYNYLGSAQTNMANVVAYARGDVNGDRIPDNVYLTGMKTPEMPFIQNITLVIQDGSTGMFYSVALKENMGYNPTLFLGDFTGNCVNDILVSIVSGSGGALTYNYVYSFLSNVARLMFNFEVYNREYKYSVKYLDNYRVQVISKKNSQKYTLDITWKGKQYLDEIYDKNGKLKKPIEGTVFGLSGLFPIDFGSDNVYELLAFQSIGGRYAADTLGYVQNTLKCKAGRFVPDNQNVAIFGTKA